jgi:hypothetical protein
MSALSKPAACFNVWWRPRLRFNHLAGSVGKKRPAEYRPVVASPWRAAF